MNWDAMGAVAELLGALVVVITVAYLAVQIRANVAATRAEGRREMDARRFDVILRIAENPDLAKVFLTGLAEPDSLRPEEAFRFHLLLSLFYSVHETAWTEANLGTIAQEELDSQYLRLRPFVTSRGGKAWWQEHAPIYPEGFRDYLNQRFAAGD